MTRLREQLEGGIQFLLAQLVIWVGLAVGNVYPLNLPLGRVVRWAVLVELAAFALLFAAVHARAAPWRAGAAPAAFLGIAFLSTAWSPAPGVTLGRAATLATLVAIAFALAAGTVRRPAAARAFLVGLLAGAVALALLSLVVLAFDYDKAVVPATTTQGARYTGIGGNPDTLAMLFALVLPISLWALIEARSRGRIVFAAAVFAVLNASIAASSSRAAVVAALVGTTAVLVFVPLRRRTRMLAVAGAVALFAANAVAGTIPAPAKTNPVLYTEFGQIPVLGPRDAAALLPLQDEIGFPGRGGSEAKRTLLDAGGRWPAWKGAAGQAADRPAAGYGFGLEDRVFVDRYYPFFSERPENSYIGIFLQLGVAGLAAFLAVLAAFAVYAVRALRARPDRAAAAACAAVVAAGLVLALAQSYLTSVGSPATAPFWVCAFLLVGLAHAPRAE